MIPLQHRVIEAALDLAHAQMTVRAEASTPEQIDAALPVLANSPVPTDRWIAKELSR